MVHFSGKARKMNHLSSFSASEASAKVPFNAYFQFMYGFKKSKPNAGYKPALGWNNNLKMEELNKNTLKTALSKLPDYPLSDSVWAGIESQLNTDKINALKTQLKEYNPPPLIWDNLSLELEKDAKSTQNTEGGYLLDNNSKINELITNELIADNKPIKKQSVFRRLSLQRWAMAATMTGLIFALFILLKRSNTEGGANLKFSTEIVDNQLLKNDWDDAELDYKMVETLCQQHIAACETPSFKTLKHELDELNQARESVKNAIGAFNSDTDLMMQLKNIEQERAVILKQIIGVL
ncbi:MAG: hypothetical protein U5L45_17560 [Saprospiraceae bacterium]|nr:hypothetical protein [Saprospiraceae bacterium]